MIGYLNETQLDVLKRVLNSKLDSANYHYWDNGDLKILNWIELNFDNKIALVFTVGSTAENIDLTNFNKPDLERRLGVKITTTNAVVFERWKAILGLKLNKFSVTNYKGCCNSSVILDFMTCKVEIMTGSDELKVKINDSFL